MTHEKKASATIKDKRKYFFIYDLTIYDVRFIFSNGEKKDVSFFMKARRQEDEKTRRKEDKKTRRREDEKTRRYSFGRHISDSSKKNQVIFYHSLVKSLLSHDRSENVPEPSDKLVPSRLLLPFGVVE